LKQLRSDLAIERVDRRIVDPEDRNAIDALFLDNGHGYVLSGRFFIDLH
jgi:hypothetical protein